MRHSKRKMRTSADKVACVVLAGGKGTRLFPLTGARCKPAVMFGGHYRLVDIPISNALNAQLRNIYVVAQYFATGLANHIKETFPLDHYHATHIDLLTPQDSPDGKIWFEGTADAVRKNLDHIMQSEIEYVLILSGDQLYNMDIAEMLSFAEEKDADLTIATLPVGKEEAPRMGLMHINDSCDIISFAEKPKDPKVLEEYALEENFKKKHNIKGEAYLASMGIYIFKKDVLVSLLKEDPREDFGKHLIPTQMERGKTAAYLYQGYWEDIGTVRSFYEANLALTKNSLNLDLYDETQPIFSYSPPLPSPRVVGTRITDSIVCQGSVIEADEIINSVIGIRAVVGKGTKISGCIIQGNQYYESPVEKMYETHRPFKVGENCIIQSAIIDENVTIGNNVRLINENKLETHDGKGIFIRDGIIVVSSGTVIPDNFTL